MLLGVILALQVNIIYAQNSGSMLLASTSTIFPFYTISKERFIFVAGHIFMVYQRMKRYIVHLQNALLYTPKDATALLHKARQLVKPEVSIRDARISRKYIEFDTSVSDDKDLKEIIAKLEAIAPLNGYEQIIERHMEKDIAIRRAVLLFNDEKYWQAHEVLEYVWKNATGNEKEILNGIILVAAAFVHYQKDEHDVCISILERAIKKLDQASGIYHGIDTNRIANMISKIINTRRVESFTI